MRELHFISSFGAGGAESLVRDLSIALTDRGIQVGIAAFSRGADQKSDENYEQEMRRELLKHGVNLYYLGHKSRNNVFVGISNFKKILREFKPDVVHIHIARALVLRFLSACNVATVYTHHSTIFNFPTALFQLFDGTQVVASGALRGLTDVKVPTVITFVAYWLVSLPLGYGLAFHSGLGPRGVWIGLASGLACAAVLLAGRFVRKSAPGSL